MRIVQSEDKNVNLECPVQQARVLHEKGENQKAIEILEKVIKEQPKNMAARELLPDFISPVNLILMLAASIATYLITDGTLFELLLN